MSFGELVFEKRRAKGLSARATAKMASVSTEEVLLIERGGVQSPGFPIVCCLADALDFTLEEARNALFDVLPSEEEGEENFKKS